MFRERESALLETLHSRDRIQGLTHTFYRYPAATSPRLVRELILAFSDQDDVVVDPFMGGGTTIVEALAYGRRAIGVDLNELAVFVTRVKTTPLPASAWKELDGWLSQRPLRGSCGAATGLQDHNLPRRLRLAVAAAIEKARGLGSADAQRLARCALLRTAQWSLESRDEVPRINVLEDKLADVLAMMRSALSELVSASRDHGVAKAEISRRRHLLTCAAQEAVLNPRVGEHAGRVKLVVTSPPYPGVHVLYHRWQIRSRRETAAPYWIAGSRDGAGPTYYTLGGRSVIGRERYFANLTATYASLKPLLRPDALVAQVVAFSNSRRDLPRFRAAMASAGYEQSHPFGPRVLRRRVPNRRWYVRGKSTDAEREFLLFHTPCR